MTTHVERVKLPGIGVLNSFTTEHGNRVGVVTQRSGSFHLVVYDADDDQKKIAARLDEDEAHTLADLLGGTTVTEEVTALQSLPGMTIDWLSVGYESACAGAELGDPQMSGGAQQVSVVAVIRGENTIPSPAPTFRIFPGDTLVAVGTPEAVNRLFQLLQGGTANGDTPDIREIDHSAPERDGEGAGEGGSGDGRTG